MSKELSKYVKGLDPVADAFSGTKYSDIVSARNYGRVKFVIFKGVGATGTSTITVEACDDVSGTTTSAIPFTYQSITSGDTPSAVTAATTAGFTTTAGSSQMYIIYVDTSRLGATGYEFLRLKAVEVADSPVLGGILIEMDDAKIQGEVPPTAIA